MAAQSRDVREYFKFTFCLVVGVTVLALLLDVGISLAYKEPPPHIKDLLGRLDYIVKVGIGGFLGLVGGKKIQ